VAGDVLTGRVIGADDSGVQIDVDGQPRAFEYATLGAGKVQVEFARGDQSADIATEEEV
jgi:ribosome maturation factor RimP